MQCHVCAVKEKGTATYIHTVSYTNRIGSSIGVRENSGRYFLPGTVYCTASRLGGKNTDSHEQTTQPFYAGHPFS